jgi:hypothetical protein
VLLSILAIVIMMFPSAATAAAPPTYPTSINGMPVVLVEDSSNTVSVPKGNVILCLYDNTSKTMEDSITKLNSLNYLLNNPLPHGWSIQVFGGLGASEDAFIKTYNDINDTQKNMVQLILDMHQIQMHLKLIKIIQLNLVHQI